MAGGLALGAKSAVSDESEAASAAPFTHVDFTSLGFAKGFKPAALQGDRQVEVILKLRGQSVGERQADAQQNGQTLTKAQKDAIRDSLKAQQKATEAHVQSQGGRVLFDYQDAYNGIAARVPLKSLSSLRQAPNVVAVYPSSIVQRDNTAGVQYVGANNAWSAGTGFTGTNVKVAIIDTGLDYYHGNFGGTNGAARFKSDNSTIIEPGSFPTAKVIGGTDFVGDNYDSGSSDPARQTPHPDPDPLDCNGHGSHVAGTAAGFGILANGATYHGPYDGSTYSSNTFRIGPGAAPNAKLLAYRVFGCSGSATSAVIVAALNQAQLDGADVVSMSLGASLETADSPDAVASDTLSRNGIVVVAAAGNNGPSAYVTGAPAAASRAISVAAVDASSPTFPGATIALSKGVTTSSVTALHSNGPFQGDPGPALPSGSLPIAVLRNSYPSGPLSLGCTAAAFSGYPGGVVGKLVVVLRGTCARVHKAYLGQAAKAAAVAMINNASGLPPFEGVVTSDPDTGVEDPLTIPFLGIRGSDQGKVVPADGGTATSFTATPITNTGYQVAASFTSGGPRNPDSALKPEVMAPGVSVKSTAMGTGDQGTRISGTSMATPMTSGVAALLRQAHPSWTPEQIKAALINTAEAGSSKIKGYNPRLAGSGVIQAQRAIDTVGLATTTGGLGTLSYGDEALSAAYSEELPITLWNLSGSAISYDLATAFTGNPLGATMSLSPSSVTVPAHRRVTVGATLQISAAGVAALPGAEASIFGTLVTARGAVTATPTSTGGGIYALRVPFLVAPRGLSNVTAGPTSAYTAVGGNSNATVPLSNGGIHKGTAQAFAWGIHDEADLNMQGANNNNQGDIGAMDVRDVGVQVQPREFLCGGDPAGVCGTAGDKSIVFAINNYVKFANASVSEYDVVIDVNNDGKPDFFVVGVDLGNVLSGSVDGRFASFIFAANGDLVDVWVANAPMNGSTVLLPTLASEIGLDPTKESTFSYSVETFSFVPENLFDVTSTAKFRVDRQPVSTGQEYPLNPGGSTTASLSVDRAQHAATPQLGWLFVTLDDASGPAQADEVRIGTP
ncbi:MAG TPA: S8 family serine peptidase [Gaiellaceae bacterium]